MLKLFIAVTSVALVYWIWRKKNQIFSNPNQDNDPTIITIEAIELQTFLDWDTPKTCLEEDGKRFGKQFQDKTSPKLPHCPGCRCEAVKLFYTSTDVFQGASPASTHKSVVGILSSQDSLLLKDLLLKIKNIPETNDFTEFVSKYDFNNISEKVRQPALRMIERAFQEQISSQKLSEDNLEQNNS